jgi:LPS O-antigen subunit length determinant protein (WzzB/FepE family)
MFALHEMPRSAQIKVIQNAINIANKEVVIVDISPDYIPSNLMLSGEPYLPEYLKNIEFILKDFEYNNYIQNHVSIWKVKLS